MRKQFVERGHDFVCVALHARHALVEKAAVDGKPSSVTAEFGTIHRRTAIGQAAGAERTRSASAIAQMM